MAECPDYNLNQACAEKEYAEKTYIGYAGQAGTQAAPGIAPQPGNYDQYIIDQLFTYQPSNPFVAPKYETVREAAKYFAKVLMANVPQGADRTAAIRKLREAVMTANAGIALGGLSL